MKLTNYTIYNSIEAIKKVKDFALPIKTSYKVSRNEKALLNKARFVEEQRIELYKKYGNELENGDLSVPNENMEALLKDYNELMAIEEEIDIQMIDIDELEKVELSVKELEAISFLIDTKE